MINDNNDDDYNEDDNDDDDNDNDNHNVDNNNDDDDDDVSATCSSDILSGLSYLYTKSSVLTPKGAILLLVILISSSCLGSMPQPLYLTY